MSSFISNLLFNNSPNENCLPFNYFWESANFNNFGNCSIFSNFFMNSDWSNYEWNNYDSFSFSGGGGVSNSKNSSFKSTGSGSVQQLYSSLGLEARGLSFEVFSLAMEGYNNLKDKGNGHLGIVDPKSKKYYLIDMRNSKVIGETDVKFGSGNMNSVANANRQGSHATLSGFQKVAEEYSTSKWSGKGTRIDGLETGINDNARSKATVIHSTSHNTTWGCIGFTPICKNGSIDTAATNDKMRRLFPKDTILFTYPTNVNEYKSLSSLV